ncbi:MAG: MMPL family transporter [Hyphomicrobiaceae bacterium]|nr:MMPL family transporter [Hyphomicrobiaceae bacterium]
MSEPYEKRCIRLTFGLEKLGLLALRVPFVSLIAIIFTCILATLGFMQLRVDDSLSELFRTNSEEYQIYETIDRRFPSSEYDVLAVVNGEALLSREGLHAIINAAMELQLIPGVDGLISMLSARQKPDIHGYSAPIVPNKLPDDETEFQNIVVNLRSNEVVKGKFLSDDGQLALIVMSLKRDVVAERGAKEIIDNIRRTASAALSDTELTVQFTGAPVMQLEIRSAVERDQLIYNGLGFALGALTAYLFFRRLSLTILVVLGPTIAILWTLGVIGSLDFRLNMFINVLTPLILVSGFSDSMHLVFAIRRNILAGKDRMTAVRNAIREVAPACLLTAMNASLALLSFVFAETALIKTFGIAAIMAVGISYLAVGVVVPTLAVFLVRCEPSHEHYEAEDNSAMRFLKLITENIVKKVASSPTRWFAVGVITVGLTGFTYFQLEPRYRLADQVPDKEQALKATAHLDTKLTGTNPIHIMIEWSTKASIYDDETISVIAAAHNVLEKQAGLGNVWSLESLRQWLASAGDTRTETIKGYVRILPTHLQARFLSKDKKATLVTGRLPDIDASDILPQVKLINNALQPIRQANPDYTISVTGLSVISAQNSSKLISELNLGLVGDMFIIFIFLGIALRSMLVCFASILPSLFPIFVTGNMLWLKGDGLQFASIIAITVAFALAIDSTIHFLNRYRLEELRLGSGANHEEILTNSIHQIGPAIVITTIVLTLGLSVTMLSDLPSLRLFGMLTGICLSASLLSQLVILPATIAFYRKIWPYETWKTKGLD